MLSPNKIHAFVCQTPIRSDCRLSGTANIPFVILLFFFVTLLAPNLKAQDEVREITKVRDLTSLSKEEAANGVPLTLRGVLTFYEPERHLGFLQDETGGVYFDPAPGLWRGKEPYEPPLNIGEIIEVKGVSSIGTLSNRVRQLPNIPTVAGRFGMGTLPAPTVLLPGRLLNPSLDATYIETTGVVRGIARFPTRLVLEMTNGIEEFSVAIRGKWNEENEPKNLLGSGIRVRGVFGSITDSNRRLVGLRIYVQSMDQIQILDDGAKQSFDAAPIAVSDLFLNRANYNTRVHLKGNVTASFPGQGLFMRVDDSSIEIRDNKLQDFAVGTLIDVVGFPTFSYKTVAIINPTIRASTEAASIIPPVPQAVQAGLLKDTKWHGELVSTEAKLNDYFITEDNCLLLLSDGTQSFSARLPRRDAEELQKIPLQSWLRLDGICIVDQDPLTIPREPWLRPSMGTVRSFHILLRGAHDIHLLRRPPFWTYDRILIAVTTLIISLLLTALWIVLLRRKVNQQTAIISEKIKSEHILTERTRIARELHDTLEQELAGIGLQLDLARSRIGGNAEKLRDALDLSARMLRRTQQETRGSIMELRSGRLEQTHLSKALEDLVSQLNDERNLSIKSEIEDIAIPILAVAEHNLLRIAQESINNAVKHAKAKSIKIRLYLDANALHLEISDDGAGFNPDDRKIGHFGLQGMNERAVKSGARLNISSTIGQGTCVHVTLPLDNSHLAQHTVHGNTITH